MLAKLINVDGTVRFNRLRVPDDAKRVEIRIARDGQIVGRTYRRDPVVAMTSPAIQLFFEDRQP